MKHSSLIVIAIALSAAGCNNNNSTADMGPKCADAAAMCAAGGTVMGAADTHCMGMPAQMTSQSVCRFVPDMAGPQPDMAGAPSCPYGDTMYNAEGDDDDCKYHLKFTVTSLYENTDVTFVVTATNKTDGSPAVGANVDAQVYLNDTHPAPNSNVKTVEGPPGTYTIGPVHFDAPGACAATATPDPTCQFRDITDCWKVRFHLYESCFDNSPESPHGHAAFFLRVP
jgi:hypothetical protein